MSIRDDLLKKYGVKSSDPDNSQEKKTGADSVRENLLKKYSAENTEKRAYNIAENLSTRVNKWIQDSRKYADGYNNRFVGRDDSKYVSDSEQWWTNANTQKEALDKERKDILSIVDKYGRFMNAEWVQSVRSALEGGEKTNSAILEAAKQDRDFWKSFDPTEDQVTLGVTAEDIYQDWYKDNSYRKKYQGKKYTEIKEVIAGMEDGEEKKWLTDNADGFMTAEDYDAEIVEVNQQLDQKKEELHHLNTVGGQDYFTKEEIARAHELQKEIEALSVRKAQLEGKRKYGFLSQNADFVDNKDYQEAHTDKNVEYLIVNGYTNGSQDMIKKMKLGTVFERVEFMTEEEIANFNYLYHTEGKESANAYLEYLEPQLNERRSGEIKLNAAVRATKNPNAANLESVGATLVSGIGYIDALGQRIVKDIKGDYYEPVDYNTGAMAPAMVSSTIRSTRAHNLEQKYGVIEFNEDKHPILSKLLNGKSWGDVYQLGMSMVDSTVVALTSPVIGTAGTLMLSGSAATQTMLNAVENGATDEQALTMGALSGAFEYLFEKYELENLLKNGSENAIRAFIAQSLSEGFGEGATTIANTLADTIVMADKSEINRLAAEYMREDPTLSKEEALKKAWLDSGVQLFWDVVGGAVSGGVMGGGYSAVNSTVNGVVGAVNTYNTQKATGEVIFNTEGGVDALRQLALEMADSADAKSQGKLQNLAGKVSAENKNTGNLSRVGKLYNTVQDTVTAQNQADITKSLERKGFSSKEATAIAEALVANMQSGAVTQQQQAVLNRVKNDQRVQKTVEDVLGNEKSTVGNRSAELETFNHGVADKTLAQRTTEMNVEKLGVQEVEAEEAAEARGSDIPSTEGKVLRGNDPVQIADIDTAGSGKLMVKLADGSTADVAELSFPNEGEQELWRVMAEYADNAEAARQLLKEYRAGTLSAYNYARGVEEAFLYGKLNISESEMTRRGSFANMLNPMQRNMAYKYGKIAGEKQIRQRQKTVDAVYKQAKNVLQQKGKTEGNTYRVALAKGINRDNLSPSQEASLQLAEQIAPAVKANIQVYNGKGEWGFYNPRTDTICLNINAKWNNRSMMAFTLGHELVHRNKKGSPMKYKAFADFLVQEYGKKGSDIRAMIDQQLKAADEFDKRVPENERLNMTEEEAFEEVVADACQRMLLDTDAGKRLAEFGAQSQENRNFLKDFGKWIRELVDKLRNIFEGVESDSIAATEFAKFDKGVKQILADMFVDMSIDAGEKLSTIKEAGLTEKITTENGGVKYAIAVLDNGNVYVKASRNVITGTTKAEQRKNITDFFSALLDGKGSLDIHTIEGDVLTITKKETALKARDDYKTTNGASVAMSDSEFAVKLRVEAHIDELAEVSKAPQKQKRTPDGKKHSFAKDGFTYRRAYFEDFDGQYYEVTLSIGHNGTVATVYNVGKIDKSTLPSAKIIAVVGSKPLGKVLSNKSIRNSEQNVNENFEELVGSPKKLPVSKDITDRAMLADMFEQMVTNSSEYKALENYRKHMQEMLDIEEHLERISAEIHRLSFAEGPRDMETLNKLKMQQKQAVNKLNTYDNILLRLEKSGVLRAMIERNRKRITQESFDRAREYYRERNERRESEIRQYYRESRRKAVERHDVAQIRQQIRKDVGRLDSLLNKGTKEKNVKLELKEFAGAALRTAKGTFLNDYNEYDMIRSGLNTDLDREKRAVLARCRELLKELDQIRDEKSAEPGADNFHDKWDPEAALRQEDREEALKKELAQNMRILREAGVFKTERENMEDTNAEKLMDELLKAYKALGDSEQAHVRGVFSQVVYEQIEGVKKFLGGKAIKDMTPVELKELQKMYRMVLHTISTSNDLFAQKRKADVRKLGEEVITQLQTEGKEKIPGVLDLLKRLGWANLKPETALEIIGSDTLTEMMQGLYRGEDTYALDLEHARQYAEEQGKKYGKKNWDMDKTFSFAGTKITLGQAMSLYAYTKRKQAQGHLEGQGFSHGSNVRIKEKLGLLPVVGKWVMNPAKIYKVNQDMYKPLKRLLTPEQVKYVDAMQEYLSRVMGAKGNEVALKLYGIKLFEETMYFPLKTTKEYHDETIIAKAGEVKLKNSGFTKDLKENAENPIVLEDFDTVWAAHVDKMSMYHGMVLPMEDFDRVYNYHRTVEQGIPDADGEIYKTELVSTNETVKVDIVKNVGKAANDYIESFMNQLNGGVRGDSTEKLFGTLSRNFKKTRVLGSLSVAVQQPTAFIRAMAYLDLQDVADWKNWLGKAGKPEGKLVEEMYKYAPVALMKHIGGFDPGMGRTTQQYVFDDDRSVMGKLDKLLSAVPEKMDELTWTYIWVCTKRQIHRQNPELRVGSKEFCEKAGERFSQIIRKTQVYDSVLTKSQLMRSKNVFLQQATAFMNEPTTSLDMQINTWIQLKRGKISGKQAARVYGSVFASQILNAAVVALVYAMRDDDEDETYWEKYVSAFIDGVWNSVLPFYSIPFVKDIISIFEGYSVERSDMAIFADIYQAAQKVKSDKATPWEKVEAFAGSVLELWGIPLKNVSRDIRGIYRTVEQMITDEVKTTKTGMRAAVIEGVTGQKPSKVQQMQEAVANNDTEHILRIMGTYDNAASAATQFRLAVKEAYLQEKITAEKAMEYLQIYAGNDKDKARKYINKWEFERENPGVELSESKLEEWLEYAQPAGIKLDVYMQFVENTKDLSGDTDKNGKTIPGSKKAKVLRVIHGLPITRAQKDALYLSTGYDVDELDNAPWN